MDLTKYDTPSYKAVQGWVCYSLKDAKSFKKEFDLVFDTEIYNLYFDIPAGLAVVREKREPRAEIMKSLIDTSGKRMNKYKRKRYLGE